MMQLKLWNKKNKIDAVDIVEQGDKNDAVDIVEQKR